MPLALILLRGDQLYLLRKSLIRRDKRDTLSLLVQFLLEPWVPCASPPASLLFFRLSGLADTEPSLSCLRFFPFPPNFLTWRIQLLCSFLRFLASLPPSPIPSSFPSPFPCSSPFSSTLLLSFPSPLPSPFPSCVHPWRCKTQSFTGLTRAGDGLDGTGDVPLGSR